MNEMFQKFVDQIGTYSPHLLGALLVLVVGWIVAIVAAGLTRTVLGKTSIDNKVANWMAEPGGQRCRSKNGAAASFFTSSCCSF